MCPQSKISHYAIWLLVFFLSACSESSDVNTEVIDVPTKQTITLRAAPAVAENSIPFSSYEGASVDIIINNGAVQTFTNQATADWEVEVTGVNQGQNNSVDIEWYIRQDSERYTIATQSGSFDVASNDESADFEAQYETDAYDHDNDAVSNLIEVNAGGFPVPDTAIPEVVDVVAPGTFIIGSILIGDDSVAYENERASTTSIADNYSIGKFEVTYSQFQTYVEATAAQDLPDDNDWGGGDLPVTNVSWSESYAYTAWLSKITGDTYRLPTEAEWEYAARGNTVTDYFTGRTITSHNANFDTPVLEAVYLQSANLIDPNPIIGVLRDEGMGIWNEYSFDAETNEEQLAFEFVEVQRTDDWVWILDSSRNYTLAISREDNLVLLDPGTDQFGVLYGIADRSPSIAEFIGKRPIAVGSFSPNAYGLYDMHGNVFEWTCSEVQDNYLGAEQMCVDPEFADTSDFTMVKRGGSWDLPAREIRSANRGWNIPAGQRDTRTGFRVVKEP